jgi:hypothetical protein
MADAYRRRHPASPSISAWRSFIFAQFSVDLTRPIEDNSARRHSPGRGLAEHNDVLHREPLRPAFTGEREHTHFAADLRTGVKS